MPISFDYIGKIPTDRKRRKTEENFQSLFMQLNEAQRVLLDILNTRFLFHRNKKESGSSDYPRRTIELNWDEISSFEYEKRSKPSPNQRWAFATLKEEVIHYLADHMGFDRSRKWKNAVAQDLKNSNALRKSLFKSQRKYNSSVNEIKLSFADYANDITFKDKIRDFITGEWEPAQEYLAELLLVADYLVSRGMSPDKIGDTMKSAFPETYGLALSFEASLERQAARLSPAYRPVDIKRSLRGKNTQECE